MSLQVWLPLNGDLHNQGLSDITVTNNGATVDNNGKIGSCYSFDGNSYLQASSLSGAQSICFWVKLEKKNSLQIVFVDYKSKLAFGFNRSNYIIVSCVDKNIKMYSDTNFPNNVWTHIALVYTSGNSDVLLYINGILQTSRLTENYWMHTTDNLIIGARNNGSIASYMTGYINDFRIYDHALSAKEVKEIAKGLVLHYKLDNGGMGNPNLAKNSNTDSTSSNVWTLSMATGGTTKTIITDNGVHCVQITRNDTAQSGWRFMGYNNFDRTAIKTDTYYTASFDIKSNYAGTISFTGLVNSNTTNYMTGSDRIVNCNTVYANAWSHISLTIKTISSFDNITVGSQIIYFAPSDGIYTIGNVILLKNIKLEEGKIDTYWIPNKSDALYSLYAANDTIVYDSSGYGNNGTIIGSLETASDSSRYSCTTKFDGNTSGILIENLQLSNIINTAITYSFWIKPIGENGARSIYFGSYSSTSWSIEKNTSNKLRLYWNGSPDEYCSTLALVDGEWQHIVITKNGTNDIKAYLNGELSWTSTATHNNLTFPTTYRIGRDTRSGDGTPYHGQMSDFRIYSTALTEAQIKELYNTSMSIDKNGNIYAREVVEI